MNSTNYLPNSSLEGEWWHKNNIPELQIPMDWDITYYEGENDIDPSWPYVRPELRVLPREHLPQSEHFLILDGDHTGKGFKGHGPILFHLYTKEPIYLPAGHGTLTIPLYPDVIMGYDPDDNAKIWADDPMAGMVQIMHGHEDTQWAEVQYGTWNTLVYEWDQDRPSEDIFGFGVRCPFPLPNNGWFFDNMSLVFDEGTLDDTYNAVVNVPGGYRRYLIDMRIVGKGEPSPAKV